MARNGERRTKRRKRGGGREWVPSTSLLDPTPLFFSCSLFFAPSPLSERLEQATHTDTAFLLENGKPVVSIQTQAVKLREHFVHFKYSLRVNKQKPLGEYLRSLSQVRGTIIFTPQMNKLVSKGLVSQQLCIETTGNQ